MEKQQKEKGAKFPAKDSKQVSKYKGIITVMDKDGNVLVDQGLRVKHKNSGLQYTVNSIRYGEDGRPAAVELMKPEDVPPMAPEQSRPLLDSAQSHGTARKVKIEMVQMQEDENLLAFQPETMEPDGFLVNIGEFKRNYEVV
jgi:hypothetical protein